MYQGNKLTRNSSGNWPQSSQLAEPLWTDPGLNSGISVRELISTNRMQCHVLEFNFSEALLKRVIRYRMCGGTNVLTWRKKSTRVMISFLAIRPVKA